MGSELRSSEGTHQNWQILAAAICVIVTALWITRWGRMRKSNAQKLRLPPGPRGWPLLGALPYLDGRRHEALHKLSLQYGPLMFMHLGSVPTVVVSNADMAEEVLKTNDRITASRSNFMVTNCLFYGRKDVGFAPYGSHWREVRKICTLELFTANRIQKYQSKRRDEVHRMVRSMLSESQKGNAIKMDHFFGDLTMNIVTQMMWNKSHRQYSAEESSADKEFDTLFREISELMGANNIGDFIPSLNWLSANLHGLRDRLYTAHHKLDKFIENILDEHRQQEKLGAATEESSSDADDFINVLLKHSRQADADRRISKETIKAILTDMLLAGTDTSSHTLEWALAELLRAPAALKRAQEEVTSVVGTDRLVTEDDIPHLPYLHALAKETLRLHPPAPLAIPHVAMEDCEIGGFHVAEGSLMFVNLWAIQRDPKVYESPFKFRPERFLGENGEVGWKGKDFQLIPFGAGRRICPAVNLASSVLHLTLAHVLHSVEWALPGDQKPEDLDMEAEVSFHAKKGLSLAVTVKPRLALDIIFGGSP